MRRARLVVAYDGSGFHGFADTGEAVPTVMALLRQTIERVVGVDVELVGAGRTDAGVHAWGQVVSCSVPESVDLANLAHRINRMCSPAVTVRSASWAPTAEFNARHDATWRRYRYTVLNSPVAVPMLAATTWHVHQPLNLWAMQLGCDPIIGEHDFSSFCRRPKENPDASLTRRVFDAAWSVVESDFGELLRFEIRANAFCQQMVRSIVGTLVDVGTGRFHAGEVRGILLAKDRAKAGQVAPPHGLCLWDVGYD
jgi:tRNA pseudouridine38-40 synthase